MKKILFAVPTIFLAGCGEVPAPTQSVQEVALASTTKFSVERVGIFEDDMAYGRRRSIYVITDKETGQKFVGVSGIGISELGNHQSGKTLVTDER